MGRTFEVLGGRLRTAAGAESVTAIPFPSPDPAPPLEVDLVPLTADDLPPDNDTVPHIEVGGPRSKEQPVSLAPSRPVVMTPPASPQAVSSASVSFQLLPLDAQPASAAPLSADLVCYHEPDHPTARQFRLLAEGIAGQHTGDRVPVLLFTATTPKSGATAAVANLAIARAAEGQGRVLVIELARRHESAAAKFGVAHVPGLRELLARSAPLTLALHRTAVEGLFVLPAGKGSIAANELARLGELLDQLRSRFEWILIDAPAWGTHPLTDWARTADGVYLFLPQDEWDAPITDVVHEGIRLAGGRLRGCVTTRGA